MAKKQSRFKEFIGSRVLWLNCGGGLLAIIVVFAGSLALLRRCTHHGQSVTVPDLVGRTLEEAQMTLDDANLKWAVADSTHYNHDKKPFEVISQEPLAGAKVKERGRTIFLWVNPSRPRMIVFPPLKKGTPMRNAPSMLENAGFVVDDVRYVPWKFTAVMYAEIDGKRAVPGRKYPDQTKVTLVVGNGVGGEMVGVPDLISKTVDEAEFILHGMNLTLGFTEYDESVRTYRDSLDAIIYRQEPSYTEEPTLRIGEVVDVWLTNRSLYRQGFMDTSNID